MVLQSWLQIWYVTRVEMSWFNMMLSQYYLKIYILIFFSQTIFLLVIWILFVPTKLIRSIPMIFFSTRKNISNA